MPVNGSTRSTPAKMKKVWKPMSTVKPAATNFANSDLAEIAILKPDPIINMYATRMADVPNKPSSSPNAENIKSD